MLDGQEREEVAGVDPPRGAIPLREAVEVVAVELHRPR
jgi:hypothetical protein